ncbi:MAG TPA: YicC/YloC family endoribonuclease [Polyangia bacterium]|nr:YicC/YloC family endoribonuclease [Polyangia bacterium]
MTGFGRAAAEVADRRVHVEIRSVNHRGLDLKIRSREPDATVDAEIARAVRAAVERGALTVHLREDSGPAVESIDAAKVRAAYAELQVLRTELGIEAPIDLGTVAAFLGAARAPGLAGEALWEALRPAVTAALDELRVTRRREGAALGADMKARVDHLGGIAARLESEAATLTERFAQRLGERLGALRGQGGVDAQRLAQEVALMAERLDVSEELVRLRAHLGHVHDICRADGAVGRKLDFVIQEIARELNTIGSKAQDATVAALVIDGKVELEKLREQAQNIE